MIVNASLVCAELRDKNVGSHKNIKELKCVFDARVFFYILSCRAVQKFVEYTQTDQLFFNPVDDLVAD